MRVCRYLRGTNASGSYHEITRTADLYQFLVNEMGANRDSDVIDRILGLYAGFTKMPDYSRHHRMEKPVAVRYAPLYLDVFPEMPREIKPFLAIGTCGLENRGNEGKWSTDAQSRETNFTQIDFLDLEEALTSKTYSHLDLMFGINSLTDETIAVVRAGDRLLKDTISIEHIQVPDCAADDREHVIAAAEAIYDGRNVVLHLEPGVVFQKRARELLLQIYSLLHPNLAIKAGYAMYQNPESIPDIMRTWSIRICVVPGEQPLPEFSGNIEIVEMNRPRAESSSPVAGQLDFWLKLPSEKRMAAMKHIFRDTERSYGDRGLFVDRSRKFKEITADFAKWIKSSSRVSDLETLRQEIQNKPEWQDIPWLMEWLRKALPQILPKGVQAEQLVADVYAKYTTEEDEERRRELGKVYLFGRELAQPNPKRLFENYQTYYNGIFEARTRGKYQQLTQEIETLREKNAVLSGDNQTLSASVDVKKKELEARDKQITELNSENALQLQKIQNKDKVLNSIDAALQSVQNADESGRQLTAKEKIDCVLNERKAMKEKITSLVTDNKALRSDQEELEKIHAALQKEYMQSGEVTASSVVLQVLGERKTFEKNLNTIRNTVGAIGLSGELHEQVEQMVTERNQIQAALPTVGLTGGLHERVKQMVTERNQIQAALPTVGLTGALHEQVKELVEERTEIQKELNPADLTDELHDQGQRSVSLVERVKAQNQALTLSQGQLEEHEKMVTLLREIVQQKDDKQEANTDLTLPALTEKIAEMKRENSDLREKQAKIDELDKVEGKLKNAEKTLEELNGIVGAARKKDFLAHLPHYLVFTVMGIMIGLIVTLTLKAHQPYPSLPVTTAAIITTAPTPPETTTPTPTQSETATPTPIPSETWFNEKIIAELKEAYEGRILVGDEMEGYKAAMDDYYANGKVNQGKYYEDGGQMPLALISVNEVASDELPEQYVLILDEIPAADREDIHAWFAAGEVVVAVYRSKRTDASMLTALEVFNKLQELRPSDEKMEWSCRVDKNNLAVPCGNVGLATGRDDWYRDVRSWLTGDGADKFAQEKKLDTKPLLVIEGSDWSVFISSIQEFQGDAGQNKLNDLKKKYELFYLRGLYVFGEKPDTAG